MGQGNWLPPRGFLELERQSALAGSRRARALVLVLGCVLIPLWQAGFYATGRELGGEYAMKASVGMHDPARFVYLLYYLGLCPVATEKDDLVCSREGAERVLAENGDTLLTEWGHTTRYGDLGKALLYLPHAVVKGGPRGASVRPFHAAAFVVALMALFAVFWAIRQPVLGAMMVLLLGFTLPLSLLAILVFSKRGMCYYSCYHLVLTALCGAWLVEGVLWWRARSAR